MSGRRPQQTLDARNPNDVVWAQVVSVLTAEPDTWLYIFTGSPFIEIYTNDDDYWVFGYSTDWQETTVNVRLANLAGRVLQGAVTAAPSYFWEDSDHVWQFAIEGAQVFQEANGDVVLRVDTYSSGNSGFIAFSYQANVKIVLLETSISGTISWQQADVVSPPPPGPYFTIIARGEDSGYEFGGIEQPLVLQGSTYRIAYSIRGLPMGEDLRVDVPSIRGLKPVRPASHPYARQVSGPPLVLLTPNSPVQTNIDFEILDYPIPS